jgi:large subunit ribosomal protein L22
MSRLWNSMKKGIGASKPHIPSGPSTKLNAASPGNVLPGSASQPQASTDAIWEPKVKTYTPEEVRRFEIETAMFRCSPQKLADLGRQLSGLPLDAADLQAQFSAKRAAKVRGRQPSEYVIREAVTGRGKYMKRLDIKGRGRCGVIKKPHAFMRFVLEIPDQRKEIGRLLKIKNFQREEKPAYIKLDY